MKKNGLDVERYYKQNQEWIDDLAINGPDVVKAMCLVIKKHASENK